LKREETQINPKLNSSTRSRYPHLFLLFLLSKLVDRPSLWKNHRALLSLRGLSQKAIQAFSPLANEIFSLPLAKLKRLSPLYFPHRPRSSPFPLLPLQNPTTRTTPSQRRLPVSSLSPKLKASGAPPSSTDLPSLQPPTIWANQHCLRSSVIQRSSRPSSLPPVSSTVAHNPSSVQNDLDWNQLGAARTQRQPTHGWTHRSSPSSSTDSSSSVQPHVADLDPEPTVGSATSRGKRTGRKKKDRGWSDLKEGNN